MSDLERRLLSKLTETKNMARIYEIGLRGEVFEEPICRYVFDWMVQYWLDSNMTLAPTWIAMEEKWPAVPLPLNPEESIEFLVDTLKQRWVTNKLQQLMLDAAETSVDDPTATLHRLWHAAYDAAEVVAPRYSRVNMRDTVEERKQRYIHRRDTPTGGMTLGLEAMDVHTGGVLPGELAALAAYTKIGKTFFLLNAATQARVLGHTPLIFTLEMSIAEVQDRIDALYSGVSYERMQKAQLTIPESAKLLADREHLRDLGDIFIETPPRGDRTVKLMTTRCRQLGADYLIIDQLSFMDGEREYRGDKAMTQKHGEIIYELKDSIAQASAGALPCLLAVQQNRESQSKEAAGRGALKNFAHSSMIEQTVDLALGLWRGNEARANNSMYIDIMGARRCDLKSWVLAWHLKDKSEISVREEFRG